MRVVLLAAVTATLAGSACLRGPPPAREDGTHRVDPAPPVRVDATGLTFPLDGPSPTTLQAVRAFPRLEFDRPLFLGHAGDGSDRIFVVEQRGIVSVFPNDNDVANAAVFLDIRDQVRTEHNEEGLLGLAFDPDYAKNGFFYLYYSASKPRRVVISRWSLQVAEGDPNRADATSERVLLEVVQPYGNHNGGTLVFGPDEKLYIGLGDGGSAGDPERAGQDLSTPLAKILRYDVDPDRGLVVPPDNPFVGREGALPDIWAYGLRNPWRCTFDRQLGTLWCGDVGQDSLEEVDIIVEGGNYGWRHMEGTREYDPPRSGVAPDVIRPVVEYGRHDGQSITGGYVYRGTHLPALRGAYVYGDYGTGNVWALVQKPGEPAQPQLVARVPLPSSFGEDERGELYAVGHRGRIYRFEPTDRAGAAPAFPTMLSQTGLFADTAKLQPAPGLLPYDVNVELWSDGAEKRRWLVLPAGERIGFAKDGAWEFPIGTVVVKHFELEVAPGERTRLETRALVHERAGWAGYTYRWNEAQTDAELVATPQLGTYDVTTKDGGKRKQTWYFPAGSDCLRCHTPGYGEVLGIRTRQLAGRPLRSGQEGRGGESGMEILADWNARGLFASDVTALASLPVHPSIGDDAVPIDTRVRAYLDVNCAICHHPGGPAPGSMDLRVQTPIAATHMLDVRVEAPTGLADEHRVRPGAPAASAVVGRMRTRDRHAMPPLATTVPDEAAIALLSTWIGSLSP